MNNVNEKKGLHVWTKEEEEQLIKLYPTTTARNIAKTLKINSIQSIQKKAKRLGLKKRKKEKFYINSSDFARIVKVHPKTILKWVEDEALPCKRVDYGYEEKTVYINCKEFWIWAEQHKELIYFSKIAPNTLSFEPKWVKEARKNDEEIVARQNNIRPKWTAEEEGILLENYGEMPVYKIEKKLGRKKIRRKIEKENLGSTTEYAGLITAHKLSQILNVDTHTVLKWIKTKELPHKRVILKYKKEHLMIDIPKFWRWAEDNKHLVPFHKMERRVLVPEPKWLEEEIKKKILSIPQRQGKSWTTEEENQLLYLKYGLHLSNNEIAERLNRTKVAIKRRIEILNKKMYKENHSKFKFNKVEKETEV
ncbi:HTH domain-containing protein [Priestia sp. SB1]|uniref:HTH domain-containing protein n=1 Tax=Priestia aryabhattai TaxID=412384 RepID=A0AAX6NDQ8_PRIAR|nr:HTH domain-containing protein [Priestia aryabhattai]MDU9693949.1 HTH domain-containing protein [Priestia aryabhattai]